MIKQQLQRYDELREPEQQQHINVNQNVIDIVKSTYGIWLQTAQKKHFEYDSLRRRFDDGHANTIRNNVLDPDPGIEMILNWHGDAVLGVGQNVAEVVTQGSFGRLSHRIWCIRSRLYGRFASDVICE